MSSAYIAALNSELQPEVDQARTTVPDLEQRFLKWYASLPEITQDRPFAMAELERGLGTQGKYLSRILLDNGWQRRRKWSTHGQYLRFWVPPDSVVVPLVLSV